MWRNILTLTMGEKGKCGIQKTLLLLTVLFGFTVPPTAAEQTQPEEDEAVYEQIFAQAIEGPTIIKLDNQGTLDLPEGMFYLPKNAANDYMELIGNGRWENRLGIIMADDDSEWYADVLFENVGYISDEDAQNWDAEQMMAEMRAGDKEQNKIRREKNLPELEMTGWIEKPTYDVQKQRLIWSVGLKEIGDNASPPGTPNIINYNTYVLGREGYIELDFITDEKEIRTEKLIAQNLVSRIQFNQGKRYTEYNAATDKASEYGLAALIGGVTAKKLGLLGAIGAFLFKFWKLIAVALAALLAVLVKLRGKRKDAA